MKKKDDAITGAGALMIARLEKENKTLTYRLAKEREHCRQLMELVYELNQKLIDKTADSFKEALRSHSNDTLTEISEQK